MAYLLLIKIAPTVKYCVSEMKTPWKEGTGARLAFPASLVLKMVQIISISQGNCQWQLLHSQPADVDERKTLNVESQLQPTVVLELSVCAKRTNDSFLRVIFDIK